MRWIIETECEHGSVGTCNWELWPHRGPGAVAARSVLCAGGSRIVVDPDNLPPEAIERAARAIVDMDGGTARQKARATVRAFLSDLEPGEQGLKVAWSEMYPEPGDQT